VAMDNLSKRQEPYREYEIKPGGNTGKRGKKGLYVDREAGTLREVLRQLQPIMGGGQRRGNCICAEEFSRGKGKRERIPGNFACRKVGKDWEEGGGPSVSQSQ